MASSEKSFTGVSMVNPNFFPSASMNAPAMPSPSALEKPMACSAPWCRESDLSGKMMSGEIFIRYPRPEQCGQAPNGLLKENMRGLSSSMEMPQSGHA